MYLSPTSKLGYLSFKYGEISSSSCYLGTSFANARHYKTSRYELRVSPSLGAFSYYIYGLCVPFNGSNRKTGPIYIEEFICCF